MKSSQAFFFSIGLLLAALASCEKVVQIPLNDAERRLVVEAEMKSFSGDNWVRLTKSGSMYDDSDFERLGGATITVTDKEDVVYVFSETGEQGMYENPVFEVLPNNSYSLSVLVDGQEVVGQAQTFTTAEADTVYYQWVENVFGPIFGDTDDSIIEVKYSFLDDPDRDNYYIRRSSVNGGEYRAVSFTDEFWNGQQVDGTMSNLSVNEGDTIFTELMTVDEGVYSFFESLDENTSSTVTPANPASNLEGEVLGYFGIFCVDTFTLVIP